MRDVEFNFNQKFLCLKGNLFWSINGVSRLKKYDLNSLVTVGYQGKYVLDAVVAQSEKTQLKYISIKRLNAILSTANKEVKSYQDAIDIINLDRPFNKLRTENDYISLWTLNRNQAFHCEFAEYIKKHLGE